MQCNAQRLTEPLSTTFLEMDLLTCEDLRGSDGPTVTRLRVNSFW